LAFISASFSNPKAFALMAKQTTEDAERLAGGLEEMLR